MASFWVILVTSVLFMHQAGAQIYLACSEEVTYPEGCACWNTANPIISCRSQHLKSIPDISHAHTLNLDDNDMSYLSKKSINRLASASIKNLILSNNKLSQVAERLKPALEYLDVSHNKLTEIGNVFKADVHLFFKGYAMVNLTVLRMSHNYITSIGRSAFVGSPKLQQLYLNGNPITQIHPYAWNGLNNLRELEIMAMSMDLFSIPTRSLTNLTSLRLIDVRPQRLDIMRPWFEQFPSLEHIALEKMALNDGHLSKGHFPSDWQSNLRSISLRSNELTTFPFELVDLPRIEEIDVSLNWITRIGPPTVPVHIPMQIKRLNVSGNNIKFLHSDQLLSLSNAEFIDLSNNQLSTMFHFSMEKLQKSFGRHFVFYLGGNDWSCTRCYDKWLQQIASTKYMTTYEKENTFRCNMDGELIKDVPFSDFCKSN